MPWIMDMTAIRVVVARMMPSSVRKLRNLLDCSESAATAAASRKDAFWAIVLRDEIGGRFVPHLAQPLQQHPVQPKARRRPGYEPDMASVLHGQRPQVQIAGEGLVIINLKRNQRIVFGLHPQGWHPNPI